MIIPSSKKGKKAAGKAPGITRSVVFRTDILNSAKAQAGREGRSLSNWLNVTLSNILGLASGK